MRDISVTQFAQRTFHAECTPLAAVELAHGTTTGPARPCESRTSSFIAFVLGPCSLVAGPQAASGADARRDCALRSGAGMRPPRRSRTDPASPAASAAPHTMALG